MFPHRVHAYLRALAGPGAHRVGPFLASFDDYDAGLFRNYAVPDDGAAPTPDQVAGLVAAFTEAGRTPRLEYLPELCPAVEPALLLVALALDTATGRGVGGGLCRPPHSGVSELAGVGVRIPYRRRGIAAALTALLTRACPTAGITTPFLTPIGEAEERIYRSVGYRAVTEMLHISRRRGARPLAAH